MELYLYSMYGFLQCFNFFLSFTAVLQKDLVIYEMNVRAFTADESSGMDPAIGGSYLGVIEKVIIFYLKHMLRC